MLYAEFTKSETAAEVLRGEPRRYCCGRRETGWSVSRRGLLTVYYAAKRGALFAGGVFGMWGSIYCKSLKKYL